MKIIVKQTCTGCPDGVREKTFEAGKEYEVENVFGAILLAGGWVDEISDQPEKKMEEPPSNKEIVRAPENKGNRRRK